MSVGKPSPTESSPSTPPDDGSPARENANQLGPEDLKAYAHPLRMAILRYLHDHGPATSTTLAKHLGESTGQTSYHLRQLAKHRLVEDVPGRGSGRERWWRSRSADVDLTTMLTDDATVHAANVLLSEMLRDRAENLGRWLSRLSVLTEDDPVAKRSLHAESTLLLTPAELGELSEALSAVTTEFAERFRSRMTEGAPEDAVRVRAYIDVFPLLADTPSGERGVPEDGPQTDDRPPTPS